MTSRAPTVPDSPYARVKRGTKDPWAGYTGHNPWMDPPDITPQMEALADVFDAGGRELIDEIER